MTDDNQILATKTRVAWTGWDEHRFFGHAVFAELTGKESYTGLLALGITGRRLTEDECAVLDDLSCVLTLAEPRIWVLKASRLAAAYGGTLAACSAANLCMEGDVVGPWTTRSAAQNLVALHRVVGDRFTDLEAVRAQSLALLAEKKRLVGFGVPFRPYDERLRALGRCVERRGRDRLPFWSLQVAMSDVMRREKGLEPNIGIGSAAVCLDLGFAPDEIAPLVVSLNQHLVFANAVEGARQAPAVLRRLPGSVIDYVGKPPRRSARAEKEHDAT